MVVNKNSNKSNGKTGENAPISKKVIVSTKGGDIPFSTGYLAKSLLGIGISYEQAYQDAQSISKLVTEQEQDHFTSDEIMEFTTNWYKHLDQKLAIRMKILLDDLAPLKPLVILLGGVTGIGKSTLAQLLAARFGIKSIVGTDLIREVLRVTISKDLMPSLHASSYIAYKELDTSFMPVLAEPIVGFEEQARSVVVGIEAAIERAIEDKEILIIEGVHLVPGLIKQKIAQNSCVLLFQLILNKEETHSSRLKRREAKSHNRGTAHSKYFNHIRLIQEYLIEQANKNEIPIIEVDNVEKAIQGIMDIIWNRKID